MNKELIAELKNPDNWRHLVKTVCCCCGRKIEYDESRYENRGNTCSRCNREIDKSLKQKAAEANRKKKLKLSTQ